MLKPFSKTDAIAHLKKHGLHIMQLNDINRFVTCGVEAFKDTGIYHYLFQGKDYEKKVTLAMELLVKTTGKDGILYADSEEVNGFAQWYPPNFTGVSFWDYAFAGGLKYLLLTDFFGTVHRIDYIEQFSFKKKADFTKNQDIFLYYLAVRPSMQKKGIASKLMRPMLQYADSINRPCYCETYEQKNVKMYEHFGFKQLQSTKVPDSSETHYPMFYKVQ